VNESEESPKPITSEATPRGARLIRVVHILAPYNDAAIYQFNRRAS